MRYYILILLLVLVYGPLSYAQNSEILSSNQVIARVDEEVITLKQVARRAIILDTNLKNALMSAIEDKLFVHQSTKEGIKVTDSEVENYFKERLAQFENSDDFNKSILEPLNMTKDDYLRDLKDQMLKNRYIDSKTSARGPKDNPKADSIIDTFVSPKEIKEFFEANKEKFIRPERIKLRQIILKFSNSFEQDKKMELAQKITEELRAGAGFDDLARKYSDSKKEEGGLWDWTEKGTFLGEVEKIVYGLNPGDVSPVITTDWSYIIAKVEDRFSFKPTFDNPEIQEEIKRILISQKIVAGANALKQKLLKDASIQIEKDFK